VKEEVSATALLSIAVTLLTLAVDMIRSGQYTPGILCALLGVVLVLATVLLVERGVVQRLAERREGGWKGLDRGAGEWAERCLSTTVGLPEVEIDTTDEWVLRKLGVGGGRNERGQT
jgi:hypothetical protein